MSDTDAGRRDESRRSAMASTPLTSERGGPFNDSIVQEMMKLGSIVSYPP